MHGSPKIETGLERHHTLQEIGGRNAEHQKPAVKKTLIGKASRGQQEIVHNNS